MKGIDPYVIRYIRVFSSRGVSASGDHLLITHPHVRVMVFRVVGEDDFFADLGISYKDFDMPDEVDDYYDAKEDPEIAKDK